MKVTVSTHGQIVEHCKVDVDKRYRVSVTEEGIIVDRIINSRYVDQLFIATFDELEG